jgi:hypothetical protein
MQEKIGHRQIIPRGGPDQRGRPFGPATACLPCSFNSDCTAARSPCFAAVTSDTSPAPAASAAPAQMIEPAIAAAIVVFVFIAFSRFDPGVN